MPVGPDPATPPFPEMDDRQKADRAFKIDGVQGPYAPVSGQVSVTNPPLAK